jgi:hypothetical protein
MVKPSDHATNGHISAEPIQSWHDLMVRYSQGQSTDGNLTGLQYSEIEGSDGLDRSAFAPIAFLSQG